MSTNKGSAQQDTNLNCTKTKDIYEAIITTSYCGWDSTDVQSLGFFENWFSACEAADNYVYNACSYTVNPYKWKIKKHVLHLETKEKQEKSNDTNNY